MEDYRKYNKRPKSITEFKKTYSNNVHNRNSNDKRLRRQEIVKYIIISVLLAFVVLAGFLITDALLNISEVPYVHEETTTAAEEKTDIDEKYFEEQVTVNAEDLETPDNEDDIRE